jgi:hypothetical protein
MGRIRSEPPREPSLYPPPEWRVKGLLVRFPAGAPCLNAFPPPGPAAECPSVGACRLRMGELRAADH